MLKACIKRAIRTPSSIVKIASYSRFFAHYTRKNTSNALLTCNVQRKYCNPLFHHDVRLSYRNLCSQTYKIIEGAQVTEVKFAPSQDQIISDTQNTIKPEKEGEKNLTLDQNNEFVIEENGKSMLLRMDRKESGETYIEVRLPGSDIIQRWEPIPEKAPFKDADFLCLGENYTPEIDPYGWWMSEKYDGTRGYWDGQKLHNRTGGEINPPKEFIDQLPQGVQLDGELWISYCSQHLVNKTIHQGGWNKIKYMVFDAPAHKGTFEERMEFLKEVIKPNLPQVKIVEHKKCEGKHQMIKAVDGE